MATTRTSDVIESLCERAILFVFGSLALGLLSFLMLRYGREGGWGSFGTLLALLAGAVFLFALFLLFRTKNVEAIRIDCPICTERNELAEMPVNEDVRCIACNHLIPIKNGVVLPVQQVRCGYCQALNYYSEKTEVLICESCNREIPLFVEEGRETKVLPKFFTAVDDNQMYELVLIDAGRGTEELIGALQRMLALNRNQVKEMLQSLPVTLMQGIPRMKAETLQAQLHIHGAQAEYRIVTNV